MGLRRRVSHITFKVGSHLSTDSSQVVSRTRCVMTAFILICGLRHFGGACYLHSKCTKIWRLYGIRPLSNRWCERKVALARYHKPGVPLRNSTRYRIWLRHYVTSVKVAGSRPDLLMDFSSIRINFAAALEPGSDSAPNKWVSETKTNQCGEYRVAGV